MIPNLCSNAAAIVVLVLAVNSGNCRQLCDQHGRALMRHIYNPCTFPRTQTECQVGYHGAEFMCDPIGLFTSTEVEFIGDSLRHNFTSCGVDRRTGFRTPTAGYIVSVVVVPSATFLSPYLDDDFIPNRCSSLMADLRQRRHRVAATQQHSPSDTTIDQVVDQQSDTVDNRIKYSDVLISSYADSTKCEPDLTIVIILSWFDYATRSRPVISIIPRYRNRLERLQSWLHADSSSPVVEFDNCLHTFDLLLNYLTILNEVMSCRHLDGSPARRLQLANNIDCAQLLLLLDGPNNGSYAIPSWALILGFISLVLAVLGILTANYINSYKSVRTAMYNNGAIYARIAARHQWRAGFGGGLFGGVGAHSKASYGAMDGGYHHHHQNSTGRNLLLFRQFTRRDRSATGNTATAPLTTTALPVVH